MRAGGVLGAVAVLLLGACSAPIIGQACTQMGASNGISVTVARDRAPLRDLVLIVCLGSDCTPHPVRLDPGAATVPDPCPSTADPDTACSATSTPDGTQVGFVEIPMLTVGTVRVSATAQADGRTIKLPARPVEVREFLPNGPGCEPTAYQASVTVAADGIR